MCRPGILGERRLLTIYWIKSEHTASILVPTFILHPHTTLLREFSSIFRQVVIQSTNSDEFPAAPNLEARQRRRHAFVNRIVQELHRRSTSSLYYHIIPFIWLCSAGGGLVCGMGVFDDESFFQSYFPAIGIYIRRDMQGDNKIFVGHANVGGIDYIRIVE